MKTIVISFFLLVAGIAAAATPEEKELDKALRKAFIRKDNTAVAELIPDLTGAGISEKFRLNYLKNMLIGSMSKGLNRDAYKAIAGIIGDTYDAKREDTRALKPYLQLSVSALGKVGRDSERFMGILRIYRRIEDPAAVSKIKKALMQFQQDAPVIVSAFRALENQRIPDSISLINDIYYKAFKKSDKDDPKEKDLAFYMNIQGAAQAALESLTGEIADDPQEFNKWWMNNRSRFKVQPKPEPEEEAQEEPVEEEAGGEGEEPAEDAPQDSEAGAEAVETP